MFGRKGGGGRNSEEADPVDPNEYEKIKSKLDDGEKVLMAVRQSRVKPGGAAVLTPNTIFVTEKRVMIRNPTKLGLGENIEGYTYDQITSVKIKHGLFSSSLEFVIPGMTELSKSGRNIPWGRNDEGVIDAIPKAQAEKMRSLIQEKLDKAKQEKNRPFITQQQQSPADALKMKYVNGEISEEEYLKMKKILDE